MHHLNMPEIHGVRRKIGCDELGIMIICGDEHEMKNFLMGHEQDEIDSDHVQMNIIFLVHMNGVKCTNLGKIQSMLICIYNEMYLVKISCCHLYDIVAIPTKKLLIDLLLSIEVLLLGQIVMQTN